MNLTPEQKEQGRRRFLRAVAEGPGMEAVQATTSPLMPAAGFNSFDYYELSYVAATAKWIIVMWQSSYTGPA